MKTNHWLLTLLFWLLWIGASGCQNNKPRAVPGPPPDNLFTEELLHYQVVSAEGRVVGPVDGLVVGRESAEALYVVVRLEDLYDFGKGGGGPQDRFLIVPWSHLELDTAHQRIVTDVSMAAVAEAPRVFDLPNTSTPTWDAEIRSFWASQ